MLRTIKAVTIVLFIVVLAGFVGFRYYKTNVQDNVSPQIFADTQVLEVSVKATNEDLLKGITAKDDRDGDLTSEVIIQSISQLMTVDTASITYLVFDSSNNMGTLKRTLKYTDYEHPHFTVTQSLFYLPNDNIIVTDRIGCTDKTKDYSDAVRIVSHNVNSKVEGRYDVTVQVMNDMGDYVSVTLPLVVSDDYGRQQLIYLNEYLHYYYTTDADTTKFDAKSFIKSARTKTGTKISTDQVLIKGDDEVNLKEAGTYTVSYTYEDCTVYLTIVVEKEGA